MVFVVISEMKSLGSTVIAPVTVASSQPNKLPIVSISYEYVLTFQFPTVGVPEIEIVLVVELKLTPLGSPI